VARFQREAEALAAIHHQNIASIHDLQEAQGLRFLVLELVEGDTLEERIAQGPIPIDECLAIARQICEALEAAHEKGIVPRDLKPANIKIAPGGTVKVLDFGLAKFRDTVSGSAGMSHSPTQTAATPGIIIGTAAYMSPEQARGKPVDRGADAWAFGCVLFEMLSGRKAFDGETITDVLSAIVRAEPEWKALPAGVPLHVHRVLRRCLHKDQRLRLRDAGAIRLELLDTLEGIAHTRPEGSHFSKRRLIGATIGIVALVAVTTLVTRALQPQLPEAPSFRFTIQPNRVFPNPGVTELAVSPDGRFLVFTGESADRRVLWLRKLDSTDARVISGTEGGSSPFWSPDGKFIGFWVDAKLKRVAIDGGSPELICETGVNPTRGTWNRDGVIVFTGVGGTRLFRVSSSGGTPSPLITTDVSPEAHRYPHFLPDGKHLLYTVFGGSTSGVYVRSLDAPDARRVLAADGNVMYVEPGMLLAVREGKLVAYPFDAATLTVTGDSIGIADGVGTSTVGASTYRSFSASQNGILAYGGVGSGGGTQLAWFDRSGKRLETIGAPDRYSQVRLAPDEKRVLLQKFEGTGADVWMAELSTHIFSRLTVDAAFDVDPIWSPDGRRLAFASSRKGNNDIWQKIGSPSGVVPRVASMPFAPFSGIRAMTSEGRGGSVSTMLLIKSAEDCGPGPEGCCPAKSTYNKTPKA